MDSSKLHLEYLSADSNDISYHLSHVSRLRRIADVLLTGKLMTSQEIKDHLPVKYFEKYFSVHQGAKKYISFTFGAIAHTYLHYEDVDVEKSIKKGPKVYDGSPGTGIFLHERVMEHWENMRTVHSEDRDILNIPISELKAKFEKFRLDGTLPEYHVMANFFEVRYLPKNEGCRGYPRIQISNQDCVVAIPKDKKKLMHEYLKQRKKEFALLSLLSLGWNVFLKGAFSDPDEAIETPNIYWYKEKNLQSALERVSLYGVK